VLFYLFIKLTVKFIVVLFAYKLNKEITVYINFLGPFTNLRKAIITFIMSVRMKELGSHWIDFH